jgi:drug/metabolite transporter (DMT)-like permease
MIKYLLIPLGMIASAVAQVLLKKAGAFTFKEISFFIYFCFAGISYVVSFGLYTIILKYFPITKISPVMTLGTMSLVIISGIVLFHEIISIKQAIGILLGAVAIILIIA